MPPLLEIDSLDYSFASSKPGAAVLRDVSLTLGEREFVSIVGPSGCGKSTLLTLISGLAKPTAGSIRLEGTAVNGVSKDVGFIFQRDALLPWKTLRENVALALKYRGVSKSERLDRAQDWLARVGLRSMGDRYPHQVSGGQRKRASICATMVYEPLLMLMDEPFAAIDVQTRDQIEDDIVRVWGELERQTVLFVTHDLEEAVALSDRVIVMSRGPGKVMADFRIDLPRPRDVREIRTDDRFRDHTATVWDSLRSEVAAARERDAEEAGGI